MQTNHTIPIGSPLQIKGQALLDAAFEYWQEYNRMNLGPSAVVWLEAENGNFVMFTRGEYRHEIMDGIRRRDGFFATPFINNPFQFEKESNETSKEGP